MKYRSRLPQLNGHICLTDGGLETVLVFQKGVELPGFASFTVFDRADGEKVLKDYFQSYLDIAHRRGLGLVLESPTWRSSSGWGAELGYETDVLERINRRAVRLLAEIRDEQEQPESPLPISGCIGPRGDGYTPSALMTDTEAEAYHEPQLRVLTESGADLISALTLNYPEEAIGLVRGARTHEIPIAISFTVETDGRLPNGDSLAAAIQRCDEETGGYPAYYMVNCAHPSHFQETFERLGDVAKRLGRVRANASRMSHAELDAAEELDRGEPAELGREIAALRKLVPNLNVVGGCCGTDHEHIGEIAAALK